MRHEQGVLRRAVSAADTAERDDDSLSVDETALKLGWHKQTVYRQLRAGRLPCESWRVGRKWRVRRQDVELLSEQLQQIGNE